MIADWKAHITTDPAILVGKPTIRGLRISVEHILRALSNGVAEPDLLADYPDLNLEDLRACQAYAAEMIASDGCIQYVSGVINPSGIETTLMPPKRPWFEAVKIQSTSFKQ